MGCKQYIHVLCLPRRKMLSHLFIKLFAGAVLLLSLVQCTVITDPPGNGESMDIIYVPVMENDNISLYCFMSGVNTFWELLVNGSVFTLNNNQTNFHISDNEASGSNLTIISFIEDMDRIKLRCNVSNNAVIFQLGLPSKFIKYPRISLIDKCVRYQDLYLSQIHENTLNYFVIITTLY